METNRIYTVKARLTPDEYKMFCEHVQDPADQKINRIISGSVSFLKISRNLQQ